MSVARLYPFTFKPRLKERVWGGRQLEQLYSKKLPPDVPIGESWEIVDRPGDISVISNGPFAGSCNFTVAFMERGSKWALTS